LSYRPWLATDIFLRHMIAISYRIASSTRIDHTITARNMNVNTVT
jgi:hypothetical protein